MDKEQARFILRCFRADGADAGCPDFEEALRLAAEDRELGEWLAHERAHDACFCEALASVPLPGDLRGAILAGLAVERGEEGMPADPGDASWVQALSAVRPRDGLREEILEAMRRSAQVRPARRRWFGYSLAAAAGIAAALLVAWPGLRTDAPSGADHNLSEAGDRERPLPIEAVQVGFLKELESPSFDLDLKKPDQRALFDHLQQRSLPCPCCMPRGLAGVQGIGCRELVINGHRGSVICFRQDRGGVVHMVVFRKGDISGDFPEREHPRMGRWEGWSTASWKHVDQVFVLLGKTEPAQLERLF